MKKITLFILAGMFTIPALAADIEAGKAKTGMCMACHGVTGISSVPMYPNLAGQKAMYLVKQLKDFKSGKRQDPTMKGMVMALSDDDIANVSAYYESLK